MKRTSFERRQEAARLRALARKCRDLAKIISYLPDREALIKQALCYDESAKRIEDEEELQR